MTTTADNLKQLFPGFEKELVEEILESGEIIDINENEVLMRKGQYFRSTMLLLEGLVKVYRQDEEGNEFFMYYLEPGKACALSMICAARQEKSELMAIAMKSTKVLSIPLKKMDAWMTTYKNWYHFVLGTYRERFEEVLLTIDHIAFRNMDERLLFYLKRHQEQMKSNILPLTHHEIAQDLNSSREVITRLLKKMAEKGMIRMQRQHIEIVQL